MQADDIPQFLAALTLLEDIRLMKNIVTLLLARYLVKKEIFMYRKDLGRNKFYWIYDCIAIEEILEYCGIIHQLRH